MEWTVDRVPVKVPLGRDRRQERYSTLGFGGVLRAQVQGVWNVYSSASKPLVVGRAQGVDGSRRVYHP